MRFFFCFVVCGVFETLLRLRTVKTSRINRFFLQTKHLRFESRDSFYDSMNSKPFSWQKFQCGRNKLNKTSDSSSPVTIAALRQMARHTLSKLYTVEHCQHAIGFYRKWRNITRHKAWGQSRSKSVQTAVVWYVVSCTLAHTGDVSKNL
jgi:hypothetical protein